jgi:inorganic triphosphatase YgiF
VSRERQLFRDLYLDTPDDALKRREAQCRLRLGADDRRFLTLTMPDPSGTGIQRFDARIEGDDPKAALSGSTEPARRLRGLVDPVALKPQVEIEMDRTIREGAGGAFRYYRVGFLYDLATVRSSGLSRSFAELMVRRRRGSRPKLSDVQRELEAAWGLRTSLTSKLELARGVLRSVASEAAARGVARGRFVAALAVDGASIAFLAGAGGELTLPVAAGSGEEACRHVLASRFGSDQ